MLQFRKKIFSSPVITPLSWVENSREMIDPTACVGHH
jgi:hypothetical protein